MVFAVVAFVSVFVVVASLGVMLFGGKRRHRAWVRPGHSRSRQTWRGGTELFLRCRSRRVLRPGLAGAGRRAGRASQFPAPDPACGEASAGAHRRRLRAARRSAAAPGPRLDRDRRLARRRGIYYETLGQNWERAAMIKARADRRRSRTRRGVSSQEMHAFIWRKYFDYAAIADIHAMKRQIHAAQGPCRDRRRRA